MISIHLDKSLESLQHLLVSTSPTCSALVNKSFFLAVMMGFVCLTVGSTPEPCFGDVPHRVRLPENLRTRAVVIPVFPHNHPGRARDVVMVLPLSGFSDIFSIIWSNSSLMVVSGKRSYQL